MSGLGAQTRELIGLNALALAQHGWGSGAATEVGSPPPEKQWWNLPAKYEAARRIKDETLRQYPGWNNPGDATRHAELSRRKASEIDPVTAYVASATHELDNSFPADWARFAPGFLKAHARENWHGQPAAERLMDERNNAEGRRAAREHRSVAPRRLQTGPDGPVPPGAPYQPWSRQ